VRSRRHVRRVSIRDIDYRDGRGKQKFRGDLRTLVAASPRSLPRIIAAELHITLLLAAEIALSGSSGAAHAGSTKKGRHAIGTSSLSHRASSSFFLLLPPSLRRRNSEREIKFDVGSGREAPSPPRSREIARTRSRFRKNYKDRDLSPFSAPRLNAV